MFNPLLSDTHSNFSLAKDIDPDSNVSLDLADCRYFVEDQFNEFLQVQNIDKNRLSFMHINTRGLQCNLNGVSNLLSNIALNFSFIGISETWLQAFDHNVHLHHCHDLMDQFLDTMFLRSFVPLITRPTRITSNKATLIDNIFTNDIDNCAVSGLFVC